MGRRIADAAAAGDRGDQRNYRVDGPIVIGDAGSALLSGWPGIVGFLCAAKWGRMAASCAPVVNPRKLSADCQSAAVRADHHPRRRQPQDMVALVGKLAVITRDKISPEIEISVQESSGFAQALFV
jgi:hypothetical protein